ncbi:HalX domain-containing protein [Haloarchaeobius iranensis]|uniref:Response regulator receiver domain-containing protein n=1 Tax=Haloarchaeobius iranensis TaxID=996166 RepID=A0A1G9SJG2_9EURY|nr:HalX domain-containing protein [Haloarchaeobius iranensis]SDM35644.1 Response regulator receiver domain-containing protein [Haloarchaeobius iranensis]
MSEGTNVLVVEDNTELASLYSSWLGAEWAVTSVSDGDEAVEAVTSETEIIVLDRRLPGRSGDEVLERVRADGYDCQVVIVTAVEPDFDIIEMGFDDYLVKPVDRETLNRCLERLQRRSEYDAELREYYAQVSKKAVLEARKPEPELRNSEEYRQLEERVAAQADRADSLLDELFESGSDVQLFHGLLGGHAGTAN